MTRVRRRVKSTKSPKSPKSTKPKKQISYMKPGGGRTSTPPGSRQPTKGKTRRRSWQKINNKWVRTKPHKRDGDNRVRPPKGDKPGINPPVGINPPKQPDRPGINPPKQPDRPGIRPPKGNKPKRPLSIRPDRPVRAPGRPSRNKKRRTGSRKKPIGFRKKFLKRTLKRLGGRRRKPVRKRALRNVKRILTRLGGRKKSVRKRQLRKRVPSFRLRRKNRNPGRTGRRGVRGSGPARRGTRRRRGGRR